MELLRTSQHMEEAVKEKIFMVWGPYPISRNVLQAQGWVEKFSNTVTVGTHLVQQQEPWKLLDEEDSGDEQWEAALGPEPGSASCWAQPSVEILDLPEEEDAHWYDEDLDGIHIMSSVVWDQTLTFIWTSQSEDVNFRLLQVVNHFNCTRAFTTRRYHSHTPCSRGLKSLPQCGTSALPKASPPPAAVPPRTLPACPGQQSCAAGRRHEAAPAGRQKSCYRP